MKSVLIKLGGSVITDIAYRKSILRQVVELSNSGYSISIVHGGGKLITSYMDKLGIKSEYFEGLRITPDETLDVVMMVLIGKVNKDIVKDLTFMNVKALGLCGGDVNLINCKKLEVEAQIDLGKVGVPVAVNKEFYDQIILLGCIPVIATIALGNDSYYNINADHTAAFMAQELGVDHLIFVSDVDGVLHPETKERFELLDKEKIHYLKNEGIIKSGMLPKLQSCIEALEKGVSKVTILNGKKHNAIIDAITKEESVGTEILLKS
ncbi:MAG: acetylglutamate kinase [Cyanobacteriota bacterium]